MMREKKLLLHSSPVLHWDLSHGGRYGLRRDLPGRPAEAGGGRREEAAASATGGGCSGDARLKLPPRPRPPARPRWAPARGSAGWRGRPGKEPWPAAPPPRRRPGAPLCTLASVRDGTPRSHPSGEPTSEAKQKCRTCAPGKEGISQKTRD